MGSSSIYVIDHSLRGADSPWKIGINNGDGLSTMIYAMGTKKGYEYVEKLKNVEAVFVDKDNKVYITPGLKDKFQLSEKNI